MPDTTKPEQYVITLRHPQGTGVRDMNRYIAEVVAGVHIRGKTSPYIDLESVKCRRLVNGS